MILTNNNLTLALTASHMKYQVIRYTIINIIDLSNILKLIDLINKVFPI